MDLSTENFLTLHIVIMTVFLVLVAMFLIRSGLFRWDRAGFWAWAAFALYYVLNPLFTMITGDLNQYNVMLQISGGFERGLWILFVIICGIMAFFVAYLRTKLVIITWRLQSNRFTLPMLAIMAGFFMFGIYSLLTQRALVVPSEREKIIESGRFVGQVTGYENSGYLFLIVPIVIMLLSRSRFLQLMGWLASGLLAYFVLPSGWSRFAMISIVIVVSLANTIQRKASWPRWFFFPLLLVFTLTLQMRGHTRWTLQSSGSALFNLAGQVVRDLVSSFSGAVASSEVSALSTLYLQSFAADKYWGYTYGLPLVNYLLTGWIPSRLFPQKYFLVDWLSSLRTFSASAEGYLYGTKSTLLGSFYTEGGVFGVILLAALVGYLCRRLDGMAHPRSPLLVRATGIAWMSYLWMVWQSSDTWSVMVLGTLVLPSLFVWLIAPKVIRRRFVATQPVRFYPISDENKL